MNREKQTLKKDLEEQLIWSKEQIHILDKMDRKLHEMKRIAEYATEHELSTIEVRRLNSELKNLQDAYDTLSKEYNPIFYKE